MLNLSTRTARGDAVTLELKPGINRIGRHPDNDLQFNDASVSSFHCEITVNDDEVVVKDLNSTNGTFLEGRPLQEGVLLPGQHLHLGSVDFLCAGTVEAETQKPPLAPLATACRRHPGESARWICSRCRQPLCDACVKVREAATKTWRLCPVCGADCRSLAELAAKEETEQVRSQQTFFQRLPGTMAYPFAKQGVTLLVAGTVFFWLLGGAQKVAPFAGLFGLVAFLIVTVFIFGYLFAYMQRIVMASARDEESLPGWPDFTDWGSDIIRPCFMFLFTILICAVPFFIYLVGSSLHGTAVKPVILYLLAGLSLLYFPMALLAVSLSDNFFALNPFVVVPSICRVPGQYLVAVIVFFVLVATSQASQEFLPVLIPIPFLPSLLASFIALYTLTVEMRILGLLYYTNRERFGWFRS